MPLWVFFFVILTLSIGSHCSPSPSLPLRMRRYADAIFTNSYRKVLGQLSARKLLQDIMSRQQGERNQEQGARVRLGRQVDSMWADQKQTALESILVALLQKHRGNSQG
ncbi:GHRH [Marmota monax]|nr:GHRH [Marmota monax]KAI6068936.1 GHRH [Marmota monax]